MRQIKRLHKPQKAFTLFSCFFIKMRVLSVTALVVLLAAVVSATSTGTRTLVLCDDLGIKLTHSAFFAALEGKEQNEKKKNHRLVNAIARIMP